MNLIQKIVLLCGALLAPYMGGSQALKSERLLSFEEDKVPSFITVKEGDIELSKERFKDGKQSLKWQFKPQSTLTIKRQLHFEEKDPTGVDTYLSTFSMWVYNTSPIDEVVEFQFLKSGKRCSSFPMRMNFKGWRAIYVSYERDMNGTPQKGMDEIKLIAPDASGKIYLDLMITAAKVDHRHHTPDIHLPFVNSGIKNHWIIMLKNSAINPDPALYPTANENLAADYEQMQVIGTRLEELIGTSTKVSPKSVEKLRKAYDKYNITYKNGEINGKPLFFTRWSESFERLDKEWEKEYYTKSAQEYKAYFNLMFKLANSYRNTTDSALKEELGDLFLKMYYHATSQGIAYGSGLGNATHYGYSFRQLFTSYYLMKELFDQEGLLEEASKTLQWYAQTNEVFVRRDKNGIDMDSFNTLSMGRICSILIMSDSPEKVQYLKAFSRWIDTGCKPAPGLDGAFKKDGGAFHHRNNYPAYAVGGLNGATTMLYLLSKTPFAVSELGHETLKNVLLTMRFYCNKTHFPLSMSGRHPDGKGQLVPIHFARMAEAGTPDRSDTLDREMAAAYLRLVTTANTTSDSPEYMPRTSKAEVKKYSKLFGRAGIVAEKDPNGNIALAYGCVSVQRRANWAAVVRGLSRYLWAAEHYLGANLYGRYLAHGSMQILTGRKDEDVTPATSGWLQPGFDWGRIPGTTALHLPIEQLKANVLNVDQFSGFEEMLYSDEAFAGGLSHHGVDGLFAMKLHEHDKYNGSLRANKSFHFLGDRIVCLGSNIQNKNSQYNTETTLFQTTGRGAQFMAYWNNYQELSKSWIDQLGTAYYVPSKRENNLVFEKNFPQKSRYQNSGKPNEGNWVNLVIDHGKAPKNAGYEYVVIPQAGSKYSEKQIERSYSVLQKDSTAHIVLDKERNITSFALFERSSSLPSKVIEAVSSSCLIMLSEQKNRLDLTVANPDLALYRGKSDELFDAKGKRVERSIYSRPWIANSSQTMPVAITLKGRWAIENNDGFLKVRLTDNKTIIIFQCKDGKSINTQLVKVK